MANKKQKPQKQEENNNILREPEVELVRLYKSKNNNHSGSSKMRLPANGRKAANLMTSMEKLEMVKKGVSKTELEALKEEAGLDYDTLALGLSTARATLINIKGEDKFNFAVSEKIIGLEDIYAYGYEVFGNKERFNHWMFRQNKALGNYTPFELVNNQFGREEVKSLIGRIDYGVYS